MPEGDTIFRVAAGLRPHLVGLPVLRARAAGGARVERLVGATIEAIETHGKNLLIHLSNGLSVRTHLRMTGTWHRYRPGERWLRPASRAALVLEVEGSVVVCFDAPIVELFDTRSRALHPILSRLGPDLLAEGFDPAAAVARLRESSAITATIGEALLDQRVLAGVGNVYRSEILFIERVDPRRRGCPGRRDAGAHRRDGSTPPAPERLAPGLPHDHRWRTGGWNGPALGVWPERPALPPLWHADPVGASRQRHSPNRVVVPALPGVDGESHRPGRGAHRARVTGPASRGSPAVRQNVFEERRTWSGGHDPPVAKDIPGHPRLTRKGPRPHHDAREAMPEKVLELRR